MAKTTMLDQESTLMGAGGVVQQQQQQRQVRSTRTTRSASTAKRTTLADDTAAEEKPINKSGSSKKRTRVSDKSSTVKEVAEVEATIEPKKRQRAPRKAEAAESSEKDVSENEPPKKRTRVASSTKKETAPATSIPTGLKSAADKRYHKKEMQRAVETIDVVEIIRVFSKDDGIFFFEVERGCEVLLSVCGENESERAKACEAHGVDIVGKVLAQFRKVSRLVPLIFKALTCLAGGPSKQQQEDNSETCSTISSILSQSQQTGNTAIMVSALNAVEALAKRSYPNQQSFADFGTCETCVTILKEFGLGLPAVASSACMAIFELAKEYALTMRDYGAVPWVVRVAEMAVRRGDNETLASALWALGSLLPDEDIRGEIMAEGDEEDVEKLEREEILVAVALGSIVQD